MPPRILPLIVAAALALPAGWARGQQARIDSARQFDELNNTAVLPAESPAAPATLEPTSGGDDDSFGLQQFLKEKERLRPFRTFAEISAFVTNNVALTRKAPQTDQFLLAAFGFEYHRPLPNGLQLEGTLRLATFRYNEFRQLDFNSVDIGGGLTYHLQKLGGVDVFARYNFNALLGAESEDAFFKNHTITLGMQKSVPFSQAHYAFAGVSGQLGFADPKNAERDELAAYAGYHLQATRKLEVDLLYRYAHYIYTEGGRRDANQTLSLGLRYHFTEWFSAMASTYVGWNRSTLSAFDYDVANGGGGLSLMLQF